MLNRKYAFIWLCLLFGLSGCETTLVSPYDPQVRSMLVRYSVEVDSFWQQMQQTPKALRQYQHYADRYDDIELNLQVLLKLNQLRTKNEESTKQTENLLKLWIQDKSNHQQKDGFKDFLLKSRLKQYQRMFEAMLVAEDAKNI